MTSIQALALLAAQEPVSLLLPALAIPSPTPYLAHVARIAHDLVKASENEAQGVSLFLSLALDLQEIDARLVYQMDWYAARTRVGSIYALTGKLQAAL